MIAPAAPPLVQIEIVASDSQAEPSREFIAAAVAVIRAARLQRAKRIHPTPGDVAAGDGIHSFATQERSA